LATAGLVVGYAAGGVLVANDEPPAFGTPYRLPNEVPLGAALTAPAALYRPLAGTGGVGKTTLDDEPLAMYFDGDPLALARPGTLLPYRDGGPAGELTAEGFLVLAALLGARPLGVGAALAT